MTSTIRTRTTAWSLGALLAAGLVAGCAEDTPVQEAQEEGPAATAAVLGQPVTMVSEVQEVYGPNTFAVGENDTLVLGETVPAVEDGQEVAVTGTVRQFVVADFERDYGWYTAGQEWEVDYDRDLVVVADSVEVLPPT